ncbi:MAG: UDP-N-acetylmuramate dehydrogenase [Candidatus Levybacteria bacterium]|nr:UDP-N-acetylmuramate dehydrogenase [Candidatus Levybacteria bacterium]
MVTHNNVPLSRILYYKIGGKARWLLDATTVDDVFEAISFIQRNKIQRYFIIGLGTNLASRKTDIHLTSDGLITAFAGQTLDDLMQFSFEHDLIGLENLGGLPSTIGGAIRGNAGAFGVEMEDVLVKVSVVEILRDSYTTREMTNEECQFSYRNSIFKQNPKLIVLKGFFHLESGTRDEVLAAKQVYKEMIKYRKRYHPIEYPSCGSVFKNIREKKYVEKIISVWPDIEGKVKNDWHGKVSMGYVIKRLGFSGTQVGGAKITDKHANYICNVDHAKASDVKMIIDEIEKKFKDTFGFSPELEAEIVMH